MGASSIALDPLDPAEADRMVRLLLDVDDLGEEMRGRILERAEGNPFFLEEIVRRLIDEELIVHHDGRWRAVAGIERVAIPDTVQGVLAARIDLLPAEEKRAIQSAAVVGRVFWPGAVAGVLNGDGERVEELLDSLERRDLVLTRMTSSMAGQRELIFKHILTRDVAYESLPRRDRPDAHGRVAEWIERTYGERRLEVAELLALHFDLAGRREQARQYALGAALRDLDRLAAQSALTFARRAAELSASPADRAAALAVAGEAEYERGNGDAAYVLWSEAVGLLEGRPDTDPATLARLCGRLAMMMTRAPGLMPNSLPDAAAARRFIDLGLAANGGAESDALVDLLMAEGAWSFAFPADADDPAVTERMCAAAARAVEIADRLDRPERLSLALDVSYITDQMRDDVVSMVTGVNRRLQLADRIHALLDLDDIFYMAAQVAWEQGRYRDALEYSNEGIARVTALGGEPRGSIATAAVTRMLLGDWDAVVAEHERNLERYGDVPPGFLRVVSSVAEFVLAARGDRARAEESRRIALGTGMRLGFRALGLLAEGRLEEAEAQVPSVPWGDGLSLMLIAEATLKRAAGRFDELAALAVDLRARADRAGWPLGNAVADRADSAIAAARGEHEAAAALARRSVEVFAADGAAWEAAVSGLDLAESLIALGRGAEAGETLAAAEPALERAGALAELRRLGELRAAL